MKIAIPLMGGQLSMHFGHCESFALVTVDADAGTAEEPTYHTPPAHEPGALPRWLHEIGADVIIAGGMGQRAQQLFTAQEITVVVGAPALPPEDLVEQYLAGSLKTGTNVCDH